MNLLEHYIIEVISKEDVTKEFEEYMRKYEPDFVAKEKYLRVKMKVNCYGQISETEFIRRESEYYDMTKKGYYMG